MAKINIDATAHIKLGTAKDNEIQWACLQL